MPDAESSLAAALAGQYRLDHEIGTGGMATVCLAEDLKHRRQVAIKVLRADLAAALGPARSLGEIEFATQRQHPHILPLLDSGKCPRADGRTLWPNSHDPEGKATPGSLPGRDATPRPLVTFDDPMRPSDRVEWGTDGKRIFFAINDRESDIWVVDTSGLSYG